MHPAALPARVGPYLFEGLPKAEPTDVVVRYRRPVRGHCRPLAIEVVLQDRVDRAVGAGTDLERSATSGFEPLATIRLGEPQDADAGAEALLGVRALAQDDLDQR